MNLGLQERIDKLYLPETKLTIDEYSNLIRNCVELREFRATIFVYDKIKEMGFVVPDLVYLEIEKLHSKSLKENNNIKLIKDDTRKLEPRRRIHKIMKGYHYSTNYKKALGHKEVVVKYLDSNPDIKTIQDRFKLAKNISNNCKLDIKTVRYVITNLKKTKYL